MATSYPTALDTFSNPASGDALNSASVPHAAQHANANDAIEAIEAVLGPTTTGIRHTAHDHSFGAGAGGAAGTFVHLGSLGDTTSCYVQASGSPANINLILRPKGTGGFEVRQQDTAVLAKILPRASVATGHSAITLYWKTPGTGVERLDVVEIGAADSAGTGFRTLRVAN